MPEGGSGKPGAAAISVEIALLVVLATLWGASYTFIKIGVESIPPVTLITARTWIAGLLLLTWIRMRGIAVPMGFEVGWKLLVQALLNSVVPFTLIAWAQQHVDAGLATILNSCSPVFAYLAACLLYRGCQREWQRIPGVVSGLVGIGIVVGADAFARAGEHLLPQLAIVLASMCYAGAAIFGKQFAAMSPAIPAAGSLIVGAIILTPVCLLLDRPWTLRPASSSVWALITLSVFSTALAFIIYFRLVRTLGPVGTTAQAYLRVPIGVMVGAWVLGESLPASAWIGLLFVVPGVMAMTWPGSLSRNKSASRTLNR